ncbi:VOC family protein [Haladaptatus sp. DJG-WS-42]|uniref:VOC family protein n=1 Tax=Haladaptatus sp. DJG-WS-42 TaxID=3120516 RepID=UPI0030CF86C0
MTDSIAPDTHIGRVSLRVSDLDRLVSFYRDTIGFDVLETTDTTATLGASETPLLELTADPDLPERRRTETGLFHTAFRVPTREALADALVRVEQNWQLSGASDHLVSEALYLRDPDGNGIELYVDRPREEWERDEAGTLRMDTLPLSLAPLRESGDPESKLPAGTDVGHIHLEVSSIPQTRTFYTEVVGMDEPVSLPSPYGDSSLFVSAGGYHHHIGANTWNQRTDPATGRGLDWFELVVPAEDGLAALSSRLTEAGYDVADIDSGLRVHGPDGIELRVRVES